MAKRIYTETVKKWALRAGISSIPVIALIFLYLSFIGSIEITGHSGDIRCYGVDINNDGDFDDIIEGIPETCYAYINFTAKEDIYIYPISYDPWGRDTPFYFEPGLKEWKLQRAWGNTWRTIDLNKTWSSKVKYAIKFSKDKSYEIRIVGYKNYPGDIIKWGFGSLDPVWNSPGYIIDGKTTSIESSFGKLSVMPHTSYGRFDGGYERHTQYLNLESYQSDTNLDFAFQLNQNEDAKWVEKKLEILREEKTIKNYTCKDKFIYTTNPKWFSCYLNDTNGSRRVILENNFEGGDLASKTVWWNKSKLYFSDISNQIKYVQYDSNNYYFIQNVLFKQNQPKQLKITYKTPVGSSGEWELFIKNSNDTLKESIINNKYLRLDPWYASEGCSNTSTDYVAWDSGDIALDGTVGPTNGTDISSYGWTYKGGGTAAYSDSRFNYGSMSIELKGSWGEYYYIFNSDGTVNATTEFYLYDSGYSAQFSRVDIGTTDNYAGVGIMGDSGGCVNTKYCILEYGTGYIDTGVSRSTGWHKMAIHTDSGVSQFAIDDVNLSYRANKPTSGNAKWIFLSFDAYSFIDDIRVYNGTECPVAAPTGPADVNYSIGTTSSYIRFQNCSPDWEWYPSIPQTQTSTQGIINATNNGTVAGYFNIMLSGDPNAGWTIFASNQSDLINNITLSTTYQQISPEIAADGVQKLWLFANCSSISSGPGINIEMNATTTGG